MKATVIHGLQKDVIEALGRLAPLLDRAGTRLRRPEEHQRRAAEVRAELEKVTHLELRLTIVAPMKAGKSTLINAIVGQSLLPTRELAMTSLPTRLVHDASAPEPVLTIPSELGTLLLSAWTDISDAIARQGAAAILTKIRESPDLEGLIRAAERNERLLLSKEHRGAIGVKTALAQANDVLRLWGILRLDHALQDKSPPIPEIRVAFGRAAQTITGQLVIVDTPGPNDLHLHPQLQELATQEIRNTSLLLLVLDFGKMNDQAAEEIRDEVEKLLEIRGKHSVFVLVNQIDKRAPDSTLQTERLFQFVGANLGMEDIAKKKQVFEVSARGAFRALEFLRTFVPDDEKCRQSPAARELAHEAWAGDWEEELSQRSARDLHTKAESIWRRSKLETFLIEALGTVIAEAAPRALMSAATLGVRYARDVREKIKGRRKGIDKELSDLETEFTRLQAEISDIRKIRAGLDRELDTSRLELLDFVNERRSRLQEWAQTAVVGYFKKEGLLSRICG